MFLDLLLLFFTERRRTAENLSFRFGSSEPGLRPLNQQIPLELCNGIQNVHRHI